MKLAPEWFNKILTGEKQIEYRLYDEKRQLLRVGDTLIFSNTQNPKQKIQTKITKLTKAKNFLDLGLTPAEDLAIQNIYPKQKISQYGVLAIHLKTIQ